MQLKPCSVLPSTYFSLLEEFDASGEDMTEVDFSDKPELSARAICAAFRYILKSRRITHITCTRAAEQVFLLRN